MNIEKIREDFPILKRKIKGKPLIYFDNAATTQRPSQVIEAIKNHYEQTNANIHRGVHTLSEEATALYEKSRKTVKDFINAKSEKEIVFTKGTTEAINLVATSLGLKKGDEVVTTTMEHHSNMVPWQLLKEKIGIDLKFIDFKDDGTFDLNEFDKKITNNTKIVSVVHASNVLGTINNVKEIGKIAHDKNALFMIDGAQSAPHIDIDVKKIGCDFFALSAHKMLGPTGIGALYAKKDILEKMSPYQGGGEMINEVFLDKVIWNEIPWKFEAGTPNIAGAVGFGAAINYLTKLGMNNVRKHEISLTKYAIDKMSETTGITLFGPTDIEQKTSVISFNLGDIHSHDVATILDGEGIAIRSGYHCAQPLVEHYKQKSMSRASLYIYNTKEEIDAFIAAINKAKKIFNIS
ncbi:aminotransferase class V-fold PLP-dependent enzyme [Candidatus Aenigmatarchaeota archaeon]